MTPEEKAHDIMNGTLTPVGLEYAIANAIHSAMAAEREACAKIAQSYRKGYGDLCDPRDTDGYQIATAIRTRNP